MRVIGLDPGLRFTGWGIVDSEGSRLSHVANGTLRSDDKLDVARRLVQLRRGLLEVLEAHAPEEAAVEATLVNKNPSSTLKLGIARGVILVTPAEAGLPVTEYLPMIVKKAVVGTGHAEKEQVAHMVARLLPGQEIASQDAADALAVAICHCHHAATRRRWEEDESEDPNKSAAGSARRVGGAAR